MYDENLFYNWTYGEWWNRIQGANLAVIDAQEMAVQAAYIGAIASRVEKPKAPDKYFDAKKARDQVLHGSQATKKKADFTIYENLKTSVKNFDWAAHYVSKTDKRNKKKAEKPE